MAINKKLITFDKKLTFLGANGINNLSSPVDGYYNLIPTWSMVFIKDTGEIWHDGVYFGKPIKDQIAPIMSGTTKGIVFTPNGTDYYYKDFNLWGNTFDGDTKNINGDLVVQGVTYKWTYGDLGIKKGNTNLISFSNSANDYDIFIPNGDLLVTGGDINVNNGKVILDSTGYIKGTHILNTNSYFNADNTLGKTWSSIKQFNTSGTTISLDTTRPAIINIQEHAHASGTLWVPWIAGGDITEQSSWGIGLGGDAFYIGRIDKSHTENSLSEYWKFDATDGITISGATKYIKVADLSGASEKVFMADGTVKALSDITSEAVIREATTTNYGGFKLTLDKASTQQSLVANTTGNGRYAVKMNANGTLYVEFSQANTWLPATDSQEGYVPQLSGTNEAISSNLNDYVLMFTASDGDETIYPVWKRLPTNAFENTTYSTATSSELGLVKVGTTLDSTTGFTAVHIKDGKIYYKDTTYSFSNLKFQLISGTDLMTYNSQSAKTILAGTGITFSYLNNVLTISSAIYSTATDSILGLVKVGTTLDNTDGYTKVHIDSNGFIYYHDTTYSFSKLKFQQTSGTDLMTYDSQAVRTILAGNNITFTYNNNVLTIKATDTTYSTATSSVLGLIKIGTTLDNVSGYTKVHIKDGFAYYHDTTYSFSKLKFLLTAGTDLMTYDSLSVRTIVAGDNITFTHSSNVLTIKATDTTYSNFTAATSNTAGKAGLVPGPGANQLGSGGYYLKADGTWGIPTNTWKEVTTSLEGYVPKIVTTGSLAATDNPFILVFKNVSGSTKTAWVPLPANAFKNDNTWTPWAGATASANGTAGYMPAPTSAQRGQFLRGDGSWVSLNNYSLPTASSSTLGGVKTGAAITDTTGYTAVAIKDGIIYYKDTNTTYTFYNLQFQNSGGTTVDTYKPTTSPTKTLKAGSNVTISAASNVITIASTNTWNANAVGVAGYVAAPTKAANANMTWLTDAEGVPAWRASNNHSHSYLPLSGGTLTGSNNVLTLSNTSGGSIGLLFKRGSNTAWLIVDNGGNLYFTENSTSTTVLLLKESSQGAEGYIKGNLIYHAGNLPAYPTKASWNYDDVYVKSVSISGNNLRINKNGENTDLTIPYATSAGSADKLTTSRTLWGKSFDGSGNISGTADFYCGYFNRSNPSLGSLNSGTISFRASTSSGSPQDYGLYIWDDYWSGNAYLQSGYQEGNTNPLALCLQPLGGNVGIGTGTDIPSYKLQVNGSINGTSIYLNGTALSTASTHAHGDYVTAIGTSGNTLTWSKGGTAQTAITVPYATNADTVDSLHASDLVRFFLSPMTSGAPADSAKSWFTGTMPSASGAIVYNVPGSEKTIIAGKSSGAYGHMLQLNYDDNYLRLLRYKAGSWQSTDWEKISAGYADSAGAVAWSNITSKPSSTGSGTQPVYWNGSTFVACTTYANASVNYANSAGVATGITNGFKQFEFNAGKTYIRWVSIAKLQLNTSNQYDYNSFNLYICRSYNSPSSESYAINITIGWVKATVRLIGKSVGSQIINKCRIAIDTTNHVLYLQVYVDTSYTTYANSCSATLVGIVNNNWTSDNTVNNSLTNVTELDLTAGIQSDYATSAGSVAWDNVSSKPDTATRWPKWTEVTDKPSSFTPSSHSHNFLVAYKSENNVGALSSFYKDNDFIYGFAGGNNTSTDKPAYVDAFGLIALRTASGWYGQILVSSNAATGIYWRTATSFSGGWKKLLDSTNYTDYTVKKDGTGATGTWGINISGSAGSVAWGNVTSKPSTFNPSSHTHNMNDIKWPGSHNLVTSATANGQEWSIDCTPGTYTGTYWLVWRAASSGISTSGTMLRVDCDTGKVTAPYGFVGNLSGTASSADNADTVDSRHATGFVYWEGNPGKNNMNDIARSFYSSTGMTSLASSSVDNGDMSGWTHFFSTSYSDGGNGSNSWVFQLACPAGSSNLQFRSRSGGTVTNGTAWNVGWTKILHAGNSSVSLSGSTLTVKINGTSQSLTNTTYSASTGLSLSGTAFSVSSTYQTYISHGESAYNSLGNYYAVFNETGKWSASGNGKNAYCLIAEINTNAGYINYPVTFEIGGRGIITSRIVVRFANQQAADPDCNLFATDEATYFYLYKAAANTWRLYAGSPDATWGSWYVYRVFGGITGRVTMKMETVSSLPSGYRNITYTGNVAYASSVSWSNVSSKPETATRWPAWSEVTGKPTNVSSFTNDSGYYKSGDRPTFKGINNEGYYYMKYDGNWYSIIDNDGNGPIFGYAQMARQKQSYFVGYTVRIAGGSSYTSTSGIVVSSSNNVGIGHANPAYKLDVVGASRSDYHVFFNTARNGEAGYVGRGSSSSNDVYLVTYGANALRFLTNSKEKMTITSDGKVGIGTTSPVEALDVNGKVISTGMRIWGNQVSDNSKGLFFQASDKTNRAYITFNGNVSATDYLNICSVYGNIILSANNNVGVGTTSPSYKLHVSGKCAATNFYTTSDRNKKQNISSLSEHIRKFQLKDTEKWHYGVIAQEVEEMFRNGEEGNMTVNYNSVLSYYIGILENKVESLQNEVDLLKQQLNK